MSYKKTIDVEIIREWALARGGRPALARPLGPKAVGVLRIDFDLPTDSPEAISWAKFADIFDANGLEFSYEDATERGELSRVYRFDKPSL